METKRPVKRLTKDLVDVMLAWTRIVAVEVVKSIWILLRK